jgi:TetR/AcrR family transcriptional regulator, transcriptional repressor for nem operon
MGRPRNFSDDEVIDGLTDVFSAHGYQATSVQMLVEASGLGKQSLYNSFGDKKALYLKALDCASARFGTVALQMDEAPDGRRAVAVFFEQLLQLCLSPDPAEHACVVSTGLLEEVADPDIGKALRDKWAASHRLLLRAVKRGQADGSVVNPDAATELADVLMALMSGLRVSARALKSPARLSATIARVLAVLDDAEPLSQSS